jgi:ribosomal protein S18 acetylase RimI-like enzyme
VRLEALEREPRAFGSSAGDHRKQTVDATAASLGSPSPGSFVLGALHAGKLVGIAGFQREQQQKRRHKGHIWGVYVTDAHRGCGIGRALMLGLIEQAKAHPGLEQITLTVTIGQVAARGLYESIGFRLFGREPRALCVDGSYVDEEYFVLMLE